MSNFNFFYDSSKNEKGFSYKKHFSCERINDIEYNDVKDKEVKSIFEQIDKNKDGNIDKNESITFFESVKNIIGNGQLHEYSAKKLLASLNLPKLELKKLYEFLNILQKKLNMSISVDAKIDSVEQGQKGDCWLIAGLNSLSGTDFGRKIISDSIEKKGNSYIVKLKGVNKSYKFSQKDIIDARNSNYSKGDDDAVLIEMAIERYLKETGVKGGVRGNNSLTLFNFLVGKENAKSYNSAPYYESVLKKMAQEPGKYAVTCGSTFNLETKEPLGESHAYSVKSVYLDSDGEIEYIEVVNPWDNKHVFKISFDEFLEMVQCGMEVCANNKSDLDSITAEETDVKKSIDNAIINAGSASEYLSLFEDYLNQTGSLVKTISVYGGVKKIYEDFLSISMRVNNLSKNDAEIYAVMFLTIALGSPGDLTEDIVKDSGLLEEYCLKNGYEY